MKKCFGKKCFGKIAALTFGLLLALGTYGFAATSIPVVLAPGQTTFTINLAVEQSVPYAGAEFGLRTSDPALKLVSFETSTYTSQARTTPFVSKDGTSYFGFYSNENRYSGKNTLGTLTFSYSGAGAQTVTLDYMNVVRILSPSQVESSPSKGTVLTLEVSRQQTGGGDDQGDTTPPNRDVIIEEEDVPLAPGVFTDVPQGAWYAKAVAFVLEKALFQGVAPGQFSPDAPMTRAMFVTVLARLDGANLAEYQGSEFTDVAPGSWYAPAVAWATQQNLIQGMGNGKFGPDSPISRQEMATLLHRYLLAKKITLPQKEQPPFGDAAAISAWAADGVTAMQQQGLISGEGNGNFNPQGTATRAAVATIFMNLSQALAS